MTIPVWRYALSGLKSFFVSPPTGTGGTVSAMYCYSVYLRHLVMAERHGLSVNPRSVIELGPGDSLGIGLMAMLTGAERLYSIDAVRHACAEANLKVFDELVEALARRETIPSGGQYGEVLPALDDYSFPSRILTEERLLKSLEPARLSALRGALAGDASGGPIQYLAPMGRLREIPDRSVDLILSQAVMEHVDLLEETYAECFRCLGEGGHVSHQIDLRCHDTAPEWNGHWKYSRLMWALMRGKRPWFINRRPCSAHLALMEKAGFTIRAQVRQYRDDGVSAERLAAPFKDMSAEDMRTASLFALASR